MKSCAILGASGHGKVIAEIAELNGYQNIVFFDDSWPSLKSVEHWSVSGDTSTLLSNVKEYDLTVVAIGHNATRCSKQRELTSAGANFGVLVHPSAVISKYANIGKGSVVMANAVVNPFSHIGVSCIINTGSTVDHDCKLAEGVHISPGVNLAGGVEVGKNTWIGIGSQVKQIVVIGCDAVVGAGSTVIKSVPNFKTVVGSPAHELIKS
ncbi:Acetyltransferase [Vibrio crassostreae]|uniref:acetyltransferase n=1 Tax=Vibrio crassostreae TaxID=246167 RepID=UPI001BD3C28A|nr:acetyltransferase [Vibrio crassostreae]CAK2193477.1 Acetyltransferase [Vibrio crassostreae]CAK2231470.1 Acetyltransferase [Vibrio crassostreae]CAK2232388.1 Acetyltransferase [Vibrio crassostreae]CAK2277034.1 Acetyltransferase [Vibrio crassostreae]CAK2278060.1 Acetyltransferase [Vibrio crassostreae]